MTVINKMEKMYEDAIDEVNTFYIDILSMLS